MGAIAIHIQLKTAEQATIKEDRVTFEKIFPFFRSAPKPMDWYGREEYLPWKEITSDFPHIRHNLLREHHFASWQKFTLYMESLMDEHSPLSQFESAIDVIITGDTITLQHLLDHNPSLLKMRTMRVYNAQLLHYAGANGVEGYRQKTPANIVDVANILLDAGAEINAVADMYSKDTVLGLAATSAFPVLAGVQNALMQMLLTRGAVMDGVPGETSLINSCLANGCGEAAEFLAERGAVLDLEGAAGVGRLDLVRKFFKEDASLKDNIPVKQMQRGFWWACQYGKTCVVDFILQLDIDVNNQQEGFHRAAYTGHADIVNLFLQRKAPLETRNEYGGTVLGAALWGAANDNKGVDFIPVIKLLVDAGADVNADPGLKEQVDMVLMKAN